MHVHDPSLGKITLDVNFFIERGTSPSTDQFFWSFIDSKLFSRTFKPPSYSPGASTPQSYSLDLQKMQSAQTASTCLER
ncbi:hypothetical protein Tco_1269308 [Tanacetum coccineum]